MRRFIPLLIVALPAFANLIPGAEIEGFGTTVITGSAFAEYPSLPSVGTSNTAIAGDSGPGFLVINGGGGGEFGGGSASIGQYSWICNDFGCKTSGFRFGEPLPFTLGVPFQVDISAFGSSLGDGSGNITFTFSVFESVDLGFPFAPFPGASVLVLDPPAVPEPATILFVGSALIALAAARRIRAQIRP